MWVEGQGYASAALPHRKPWYSYGILGDPKALLDGSEKYRPSEIHSPDRADRSVLLY